MSLDPQTLLGEVFPYHNLLDNGSFKCINHYLNNETTKVFYLGENDDVFKLEILSEINNKDFETEKLFSSENNAVKLNSFVNCIILILS